MQFLILLVLFFFQSINFDHQVACLNNSPPLTMLSACITANYSSYNISTNDVFQLFDQVKFFLQKNNNGSMINFGNLYGPNNSYTNWYKSSDLIEGLAKLASMRVVLESSNLWDMYKEWYPTTNCSTGDFLIRKLDGTCNDKTLPAMGSVGTRFSRNVMPLFLINRNDTEILTPNPRLVSRKLLAKKKGEKSKVYPHLSLFVTAWIQFQTHDWFIHKNAMSNKEEFLVPLEPTDPLAINGQTHMRIAKTEKDNTRKQSESTLPNSYLNYATHWWDLDQVYGNNKKISNSLRSFKNGEMKLDKNKMIPLGENGLPKTAVTNNWWIGLELLHNLFVKEHNAIAKKLFKSHPKWTDQKIYDTARMVNAALVAKIHTLEWTPAVISNPEMEISLNANWDGIAKYLTGVKSLGNMTIPDALRKILFGIVGGKKNLQQNPLTGKEVPFSITEEFVSVYRMHALLPETITLYNKNKNTSKSIDMSNVVSVKSHNILLTHGLSDLLLSFGLNKPAQLTVNNYANFLQNIRVRGNSENAAGHTIDLGTVDILRDRERGVPLYNEFRKQLKLRPLKGIEDLTDDNDIKDTLKEIYGANNTINKIDLLIGILAEQHRPYCFGFSETLFNVFSLMATRRLEADSFYTTNFNPEVYSQEGINWIKQNTMKHVLLRHASNLKYTGLNHIDNVFFAWPKYSNSQ